MFFAVFIQRIRRNQRWEQTQITLFAHFEKVIFPRMTDKCPDDAIQKFFTFINKWNRWMNTFCENLEVSKNSSIFVRHFWSTWFDVNSDYKHKFSPPFNDFVNLKCTQIFAHAKRQRERRSAFNSNQINATRSAKMEKSGEKQSKREKR